MNTAVLIVYPLGIVFDVFILLAAYRLTMACWKPERAKSEYISIVNARERRFFGFFKWGGPILTVGFSLHILSFTILFLAEVARDVAG